MALKKKLKKVNEKIKALAFDVEMKHCETTVDARERRKLERKRFKLERAIARKEFYAKILMPAIEFIQDSSVQVASTFTQAVDKRNNEKAVIRLTHPVSKRELCVEVFTRNGMNNKTYDLDSDSSLGSNPVVKVTIEDKGRRVYNRTVQLQDKEVIIDRVLLSHNPLLWDIQTLSESDRKAFETVKEALTTYLEAITPCTVRGLEGQDEDDDE